MAIQLNPAEAELHREIMERFERAKRAFAESRLDDDVNTTISEAGERAHRLHMLLKARNLEPRHHAYMVSNRELQPDDPNFYMHFHPIEDLLKFINNPNANDDPVDQTINADFTFRIFSRRWGHDDIYRFKRTTSGWDVRYVAIGGPCDKGGRPFLFENFRQDSIQYPSGLDGWMEWLWDQAEGQGLTREQVQEALQQLADWVSSTERGAPIEGVWEGY